MLLHNVYNTLPHISDKHEAEHQEAILACRLLSAAWNAQCSQKKPQKARIQALLWTKSDKIILQGIRSPSPAGKCAALQFDEAQPGKEEEILL